MPHVGILFEIKKAETRPGEVVSVVGNCSALSNWDPYDSTAGSLHLTTGASLYPGWAMYAPVWVQLDGAVIKSYENLQEMDEDCDDAESLSQVAVAQTPPRRRASSESVASEAVASPLEGSPPYVVEANTAQENAEPPKTFVIEYKYVKDCRNAHDSGPSIQWENSIANRRVNVPEDPGSIWIVTDTCFNHNEQPTIQRTTLAEILQRRGELDPEWTHDPEKGGAPENTGKDSEIDQLSSPGGSSFSHRTGHTTSTVMQFGRSR
mmetsp:Transcript_51181/g.121649  ORF Transcript_51181/g.121649 Transcript_51181/m.121649 type:complete len:264 (-) Transcript_51181:92-883(-)